MAILLNVQEVVESTAEEASKKLNLNMYDKVGAGGGTTAPTSDEELTAYGVTPDFAEFVRTLNYRCVLSGGGEDWLPWACTGLCRCFGEAPQRLLVHSPLFMCTNLSIFTGVCQCAFALLSTSCTHSMLQHVP